MVGSISTNSSRVIGAEIRWANKIDRMKESNKHKYHVYGVDAHFVYPCHIVAREIEPATVCKL